MLRWLRSCLARVGCLVVLVVGGAAGWLYQDEIREWWRARTAAPVELEEGPSESIAAGAEERLRTFLAASGESEIRLSEGELESLVRYRLAPILPAGVSEPGISLGDSAVRVRATLDVEGVFGDAIPGMLRRMLGDTARVSADLHPGVPEEGTLRIRVRRLRAGAVQLPDLVIPWVVSEMGLEVAPDDQTAVRLETGRGLRAARVEEGGLHLARSGSDGT